MHADKLYRDNADKLCVKYGKRKRKTVRTVDVGDYDSVRVLRIDRAGTELLRLPCTVVERNGEDLHRVRSSSGILQNGYRAGNLDFLRGTWQYAWMDGKRSRVCHCVRPLVRSITHFLQGNLVFSAHTKGIARENGAAERSREPAVAPHVTMVNSV